MFASADAYDRFMGRYSIPLATEFANFAGVVSGQRVLDVGCGTGSLTGELVGRLGAESVVAADPSEPFVAAARLRYPGVEIHRAPAEALPFDDWAFDSTLAQLVVHFMTDPLAGLSEMKRVTRPGGVVAACVWDHGGDHGPLAVFWQAARTLDPEVDDESELAGTREGHLGELFRRTGLSSVDESGLLVEVEHPDFEDWWEPFTMGVGPAGRYVSGLEPEHRSELRERCRLRLSSRPFVVSALAWVARGLVE